MFSLLLSSSIVCSQDSVTEIAKKTEQQHNHKTDSTEQLKASLRKKIQENREGKGNGSFPLTVAHLESIIKLGTLKQLESEMGEWHSYGGDNTLGFSWNDKTQDHDIPVLDIKYGTTIKGQYYIFKAEVSPNLESKMRELEITTILSKSELAEFKKSLTSKGFLANRNLSKILQKQTWENKTKRLAVSIYETGQNGIYSIDVF